TKDEHFGASIGLNYEATLGKWDFHSLNSWASRNYAGLNRGAFDFNQNIGYRISDKQRIFGRYQNTQVHPGHLALQNTDNFDGQAYKPYYYYSTQGLQTGIQFTIANWHFLFSPKFERQKNSTNFMHNALTAYRFRTTVG